MKFFSLLGHDPFLPLFRFLQKSSLYQILFVRWSFLLFRFNLHHLCCIILCSRMSDIPRYCSKYVNFKSLLSVTLELQNGWWDWILRSHPWNLLISEKLGNWYPWNYNTLLTAILLGSDEPNAELYCLWCLSSFSASAVWITQVTLSFEGPRTKSSISFKNSLFFAAFSLI